MAKDPAVLFYTSDFLSSTFHLSDKQVGKFIRLLCMQHQRGRLNERDMPFDDKELMCLFTKDEEGFYNPRMEEEAIKRRSYTRGRQKNLAGTEKKNGDMNTCTLTTLKASDKSCKDTEADALFEAFWSAYPKKVGKAYVKKCFLKLNPTGELVDFMINAIKNQASTDNWKKEGGQYIPNPSTWLNQQRWLDEVKQEIKSTEINEKRIGIYI